LLSANLWVIQNKLAMSPNGRLSGVPGRADDLAGIAVNGHAGGQGVLGRTVPERQNSHLVNGLIRVQAMLRRRTISLTLGVDCA
jgi:hypothetical protein